MSRSGRARRLSSSSRSSAGGSAAVSPAPRRTDSSRLRVRFPASWGVATFCRMLKRLPPSVGPLIRRTTFPSGVEALFVCADGGAVLRAFRATPEFGPCSFEDLPAPDKLVDVMVRGVPSAVTEAEILEDLQAAFGPAVKAVSRLHGRSEGQLDSAKPIPVVRVKVLTSVAPRLRSGWLLFGALPVSVGAPRAIAEVPQCRLCFAWGHRAGGCTARRRCLRCGATDHLVAQCPQSREDTPRCFACQGAHAVTFGGCPRKQAALAASREAQRRSQGRESSVRPPPVRASAGGPRESGPPVGASAAVPGPGPAPAAVVAPAVASGPAVAPASGRGQSFAAVVAGPAAAAGPGGVSESWPVRRLRLISEERSRLMERLQVLKARRSSHRQVPVPERGARWSRKLAGVEKALGQSSGALRSLEEEQRFLVGLSAPVRSPAAPSVAEGGLGAAASLASSVGGSGDSVLPPRALLSQVLTLLVALLQSLQGPESASFL